MTQNKPREIDINEYFNDIQSDVTIDMLKKNQQIGSITPVECDKHDIKACVVTYMNIPYVFCVNPISWANTQYYISDKMYANDDKEQTNPFKVFLGIKD